MRIDDFYEMVIIQMERQNKNWKYLSDLIEKSPTYTKQVVQGFQNGPNARMYRQQIADDLGILIVNDNR